MTEKEKMELGLWYDANFDPELLEERMKADSLCFEFNQCRPDDTEKRNSILKQLLGEFGSEVSILSPMYTDYGNRTYIKEGTFVNHNSYFMDGGTIRIGSHCFIGPDCGFYTANHPLLAEQRNAGYEIALPIVLEDNVWLGAGVKVLPGVTIGKGAVIGAGSIVTKDIPAGFVAVGNPCRPVRPIGPDDTIFKDGKD